MHFLDGCSKLIDWAISDSERQKDCPVRREVLVKLWKALEEPPSPCPASAPLAEGAETSVTGVSRP